MDVQWYVKQYGFPNYNFKDLTKIREQLEVDFYQQYLSDKSIEGFKKIVNDILSKLNYLRIITNGKFDANSMWMNIFSLKITNICMSHFPSLVDLEFFDLIYYFKGDNIKKREEQYKKKIYNDEYHVALRFMSLNEKFKKSELIRSYRKLCLIHHPDKGGSPASFLLVQKYYEFLKRKYKHA